MEVSMDLQSNLDILMTRQQTAEYLHVCRTTLDRLNLPKIRLRRRVLFSKVAIDKWLQEQTIKSEASK
jgi:hypothetical protein